jgi:hypothetical protein
MVPLRDTRGATTPQKKGMKQPSVELWLPGGLRAEEAGNVAVGTRVRVTSVETGARPLIGPVVALGRCI